MGDYQAVVLIECDYIPPIWRNGWDRDRLLDFAINNIVGEMIQGRQDIWRYENWDEESIYVLGANSQAELVKKLQDFGKTIVTHMKKYLRIDVCLVCGQGVPRSEDWKLSYRRAKKLARKRFFIEKTFILYDNANILNKRDILGEHDIQGENNVMYNYEVLGNNAIQNASIIPTYSDMEMEIESGYACFSEIIANAIAEDDSVELHLACRDFFRELRKRQVEKPDILILIQQLLFEIMVVLKRKAGADWKILPEQNKLLKDIGFCGRISQIEGLLEKFLSLLAAKRAKKHETESQRIARYAKEYIKNNFNRQDLSLDQVCQYLRISPSYLSCIYKENMGETFVETMTKARIDRAKELLQEKNKKNYEIAEEVGFVDAHYFATVFKKYTGMTPRQFIFLE